jgi:hypothetical protein
MHQELVIPDLLVVFVTLLLTVNILILYFNSIRTGAAESGKQDRDHLLAAVEIIYNGFFFGVHGIGMPILFFTTGQGRDLVSCRLWERDAAAASARLIAMEQMMASGLVQEEDEHEINNGTELTLIALRHTLQLFLILMMTDMGYFLIKIIRGKNVTRSRLVHHSLWMLIMLTAITIQPISPTTLATASFHMMDRCVHYGFMVLSCSSYPLPAVMHHRKIAKYFEIGAHFCISLHNIYFLMNGACGKPIILLITSAYSGIHAASLIANHYYPLYEL